MIISFQYSLNVSLPDNCTTKYYLHQLISKTFMLVMKNPDYQMRNYYSIRPLLGIFILAFIVFGEAKAQITGTILDTQQKPLSFANVLLLNPADNMLITGNITDEQGQFSFNEMVNGTYLIQASMVGYQNYFY